MWHQKSVNVQNESPETLEYGPFPLFAKRSVEVHRQFERECPDPALSLLDDNDAFWDKILQTPSDESLGYEAEAVNMFSTTPVELVCGHVGSSCLETLPSPAHLMGKKRKKRGGGERRDSADRQSSAVTQHIIQLRRKQSYIDSLKGEKWWSSSVWRAEPEWAGPDGEQAESEGETHPHLPDHPFSQEREYGEYGEQILDVAPGGNPMMSFVTGGTAYREIQRKWERPDESHSDFWGIQCSTEQ
ncbi:hypothetical protein AMEX_G92 [Astyanax mexicanus]|uniref:Uncharacterized protein n=1 Tax=Astyanax mexicanus TaxID=7994 RepID=A0A8T2ME09_ASTMX|nr:hypothetical protein AMEX_G92 [Astyanax mexicanus]